MSFFLLLKQFDEGFSLIQFLLEKVIRVVGFFLIFNLLLIVLILFFQFLNKLFQLFFIGNSCQCLFYFFLIFLSIYLELINFCL